MKNQLYASKFKSENDLSLKKQKRTENNYN